MEQQPIVSAEELLKLRGLTVCRIHSIKGTYSNVDAMEEYASLKLQSLTTERDEALKANDLLCEKIDKKDKEIDVLNRRVKLLKAVLNSQSKEQ
jgi:hypothetical protein